MSIRVGIIEDDAGVRQSLSLLITGTAGFSCLGAYPTAEDALAALPELLPDVVLVDINLPKMSGIQCVEKLKPLLPKTQFMMLTMYDDSEQIFSSLVAGASGYLLKRTPPPKLLDAIAEIHKGASPMSGEIARKLVQYFHQQRDPVPEQSSLSKRENEILDLLAKGYRYKEIADKLSISYDTVRSHLRNIYEKLHVHSRTEAVVKYFGR